jgi:predicted AAA+ superfamily ATPase
LFDEIQEINDFEKTIITLFEHKKFKYDIYITGSNSKMFSSELVSLFTGRTSEIEVFPFSYNEILNGVSNNKIDFEQYLLKGGLGIIVPMYTDDIRVTSTLEKVYNGLIKKDVKNRHTIKYYDGIEKISEYLFHHVGRNVSANNLENYLKSNKEAKITKKTLLNYFR